MPQKLGIELAIEAAGSQAALAAMVSTEPPTVTPQAVAKWRATGKVPAERCLRVHDLTGVPLHLLNPDVYRKAA